jgi:hypothetical protein
MKIAKIAALGCLLGLSGAATASMLDLNVTGGYTTLDMADLNAKLPAGSTKINSGYYVGADAGFSLMPFLKIGPRVEYLSANQGTLKNPLYQETIQPTLTSAELGLSTDWSLPLTGLGISGGVWGGYGWMKTELSIPGQPSANLSSGNVTGEALVRLKYSIFSPLSVELEGGYRVAKMTELSIDKGSALGYPDFDFSGMNLGAGLNLNF